MAIPGGRHFNQLSPGASRPAAPPPRLRRRRPSPGWQRRCGASSSCLSSRCHEETGRRRRCRGQQRGTSNGHSNGGVSALVPARKTAAVVTLPQPARTAGSRADKQVGVLEAAEAAAPHLRGVATSPLLAAAFWIARRRRPTAPNVGRCAGGALAQLHTSASNSRWESSTASMPARGEGAGGRVRKASMLFWVAGIARSALSRSDYREGHGESSKPPSSTASPTSYRGMPHPRS